MKNRTTLNAMIAGFLASNAVTILPAGAKAYPWATEQDWKDALQRHHAARELCGVVEEPVEFGHPGTAHSRVYAYYVGDDEDTSDVTDLDKAAHQEWVEEAVLGAFHDEAAARNPYWN